MNSGPVGSPLGFVLRRAYSGGPKERDFGIKQRLDPGRPLADRGPCGWMNYICYLCSRCVGETKHRVEEMRQPLSARSCFGRHCGGRSKCHAVTTERTLQTSNHLMADGQLRVCRINNTQSAAQLEFFPSTLYTFIRSSQKKNRMDWPG